MYNEVKYSPISNSDNDYMITENKPHKCFFCDYRARFKSHLVAHVMIHTGDKPYKCAVCNYATIQKSTLVKHMMIHTGEKPVCISICFLRFDLWFAA